MVSNASDDLPDPESPVKTMIRSRGSSSETFFRLCSRAPRITSLSLTLVTIPAQGSEHSAGPGRRTSSPCAGSPSPPRHTARYLTTPSYRYRRILFPLMGWALAPHGGRRLILALAAIGLMSVALSAASLRALPGSPAWLPLIVAGTPGVVASLMLGLSDTLALALTLLAFAAAAHRR